MSQRWPAVALAALIVVAGLGLGGSVRDQPCAAPKSGPIAELGRHLAIERAPLRDAVGCSGDVRVVRTRLARHFAARTLDASLLWRTLPDAASPAAAAAWRSSRRIDRVPFGAWSVPADPTWAEDPFRNKSWQTYYHSLAWLQAPAAVARAAGDARARREVLSYVIDWIADNPRGSSPSVRAWYDHTIAYRTDALVGVFALLADEASPGQLQQVLRSLQQHGLLLERLLTDPRFSGHNHNLFHALSLFSLASALPELRHADRWRSRARARVSTLLPEMIDLHDGVSTEGAAAYHYLALRLFVMADDLLDRHGLGLSPDERELLARMAEFGALLADPSGVVPAIGDTEFGLRATERELLEFGARGIGTDHSRFVLSRGADGIRPPDAVFWPSAGYGLFRPSWGDAGDWEDDLQVVVDMGDVPAVHGHRDAMNVLVSADGEPILVDSGGPYLYADPRHAAFVATRAHNTVVVDGGDQADGPVRILSTAQQPAWSLIDGVHDLYPSARHRRLVVVLRPAIVVIVDRLTGVGEGEHEYDLLYHLAPRARVATRDDGADITTVGGARLSISVAASMPMVVHRVTGQAQPMLGWVTTELASREPAPVLRLSVTEQDAWFASVLATAGPSGSGAPRVAARQDGASLMVMVELDDAAWCLDIPDDTEAAVSVESTCPLALIAVEAGR